MATAIADSGVLTRAVREVMDEPFPVVDWDAPLDHVATLLSSATPAALVRRNGEYLGIVTRYDVLHKVAGIR
jgi:predicted transcriptional regulator